MLRRWYGNHGSRLSGREDWEARWRWNSGGRDIASAKSSRETVLRRGGRPGHLPGRCMPRGELEGTRLDADVVWFCVPDREIARAAGRLAGIVDWKGKIALHSSGALGSDELRGLRRRGAAVASVHPLMTFVSRSVPSLKGVPFALEGDAAALRVAGRIVRDLGGEAFSISKNKKLAYHAWGAFTCAAAGCVVGDGRASGTRCRAFECRGSPEDAADCAADAGELREAGPGGSFQRSDCARGC